MDDMDTSSNSGASENIRELSEDDVALSPADANATSGLISIEATSVSSDAPVPWANAFADELIRLAPQGDIFVYRLLHRAPKGDELNRTIDDVGAPEVWVTHGREEALVHHVGQRGIRARALALVGFEEDEG